MKFDLNEKIIMMHDFVYNSDDTACYTNTAINLKDVDLDTIKFGLDNDKYSDMVISETINHGNFKFYGYDKNRNILKVIRYDDTFPTVVMISPYKINEKVNDIRVRNNNDAYMSYVLSPLVLNNRAKHILLPLVNFDVKLPHIVNILNKDVYSTFNKMINEKKIKDIFSVRLRESFQDGIFLSDYLKKNKNIDYRKLLFQLIHTLAVIQEDYKNFRHLDLSPSNIYMYELDNPENISYVFNGKMFRIPTDFSIKIGGFDDSVLKYDTRNRYYDLHYFLNKLYLMNGFKGIDSETRKFVDKIYPDKYRNKKIDKELFVPAELLGDSIFSDYTIKKLPHKSSKHTNEKAFSKSSRKIKKSERTKNSFMSSMDSENAAYLGNQKMTGRTIRQEGGYKSVSDPYKKERNNPFVSNDARNVYKKRKSEEPQPRQPQVLAEQVVYDTQKSAPPVKNVYPTQFVPTNPMMPWLQNYNYKEDKMPIQKIYNVNLSNPAGDHSFINKIFEDTLPSDPYDFSLKSIYERQQLIIFFRNTMLDQGDGEEITLAPNAKKSFLSYIKLLEINPFGINKNPYKTLPRGFLMYTAGYPIRYDKEKAQINLARNPIGLNIRMYQLSIGALRCYTINNNIDYYSFDAWRDVKFYEYIREKIIKRKICPNFVLMYLYAIDSQSNIDYARINSIKYSDSKGIERRELKNERKINNEHEEHIAKLAIDWKMMPQQMRADMLNKIIRLKTHSHFNNNVNEKEDDITVSSGKSLVAITEAPNYSLYQWASPVYDKAGTLYKMARTGFHTKDVWSSVLFQLVYTFAVLQKSGIYIRNMKIDNNIFIKDLYFEGNVSSHWEYVVNGQKFYVPNYGYLLMIDSKYNDIYEGTNETIDSYEPNDRKYKIISKKLFGERNNGDMNSENIESKVRDQFKEIINKDNFTIVLQKLVNAQIDDSLLKIIDDMHNDSENDISKILVKYFKFYLNNRIGTLLTVSEKQKIPLIINTNFNMGELLAYQVRYDEYRWCSYIEKLNDNKHRILIKDENNNYKLEEVFGYSLYKYMSDDEICQEYNGYKITNSSCIETYSIDELN